MTRYSAQPRDQNICDKLWIFVFARNMAKNISKNLSKNLSGK